jgi:enterochelin esterase-like enzyme
MLRTFVIILIACHSLHSQIKQHTVEGLTFEVYLPPNYSEENTYSTVYSNDGEWIFGNGSWHLDEKITQWILEKKIEPIILVAIYNDGDRNSRYLPYHDPSISSYVSQSDVYTELVVQHIIPFVDRNYSTSNPRAIMGASFGGLHSTWAGMKYPEVFDFIIAQSPSYWVNNFQIHQEEIKANGQTIWIDIGTKDWDDVLTMYYNFSNNGFTPGKNLFYYEDVNGTHTGASWCERLLYPFILFTKDIDSEIASFNIYPEYIRSQQRDQYYFSRINPVVTLKNDIKYTPFPNVTFESLDGYLKVSPYGTLEVEKRKTDSLVATFNNNKAVLKIKWRDNPMNR